jgi:uncharacterized membrane protein (UPF0127 family)
VRATVVLALGLGALVALGACGWTDDERASETPSGPSTTGGVDPPTLDWVDVPAVAARLTGPDGGLLEWCLLLAATGEDRSRGLMDAPDAGLGGYDGMLFAWDDDTTGRFHMLDTEVPLSIAWFDDEGAFVSATDMDPCPPDVRPCPTFGAEGPYRYALEVARGGFGGAAVGPGWRLDVTGEACAPA